jgi:hypothetical protein
MRLDVGCMGLDVAALARVPVLDEPMQPVAGQGGQRVRSQCEGSQSKSDAGV